MTEAIPETTSLSAVLAGGMSGGSSRGRPGDPEAFTSLMADVMDVGESTPVCHRHGGSDSGSNAHNGEERCSFGDIVPVEERSGNRRQKARDRQIKRNDWVCARGKVCDLDASGTSGARISVLAGRLGNELKRLVRVLRQAISARKRSVTVMLHLEGTGDIKLDVRIVHKKVFVVARAANGDIAEVLALGISDLERRLAGCGLCLGGLDVVTSD